jgi:hypothetical protein
VRTWMNRIECTCVYKGSESLIDFHMAKISICHLIKACMRLDLVMHVPPSSCNELATCHLVW